MLSARSLFLALLAGLLLFGSDAQAQDRVCPLPISTCRQLDTTLGLSTPSLLCPAGHECVCVPSCPSCRDCAAQVCVVSETQCRTACDCDPGLGCFDGRCIAGFAPVFCCESDRCPVGEQCQHRDGRMDRCGAPQCRTACDCAPGLGCFNGQCIAGFAPVFCCDSDHCPAGEQCQHLDGQKGRCERPCVDALWLCDAGTGARQCGPDRVCACSASCPTCEDCGPNLCVPPGTPTPYRCGRDGSCAQPGDRCVCASSAPETDDCALAVCVPDRCEDPMCEERVRTVTKRIHSLVRHFDRCHDSRECVRINTSTRCRGTCGAWVNRRHADRIQHRIRRLDAHVCATYREDGCPFATPACILERGECVSGHCVGVPDGIRPGDPITEFFSPDRLP